MIEKVANNEFNTEKLNLNPPEKVREKLDYYRSFFNKINDLPIEKIDELNKDIKTFFNLKPVGFTDSPPARLVRVSINNRILPSQGKELSYLTDISQLLAPPIQYCNYGRCNIPKQQILYCATSEAGAYWETKPKKGDVITLSHFELKKDATVNCNVIRKEKREYNGSSHQFIEIAGLLEEFFIDAFSVEVSRDRPADYLFSALLTSEQLFYPVVSDKNIEAIIYPSVQKKKFGENFAIRNDLIFERYNLIGVETRFILDEYESLDPSSNAVTTDQLIGSFGTKAFDFENGKILYNEKVDYMFNLFRQLQANGEKQVRHGQPNMPKNLAFDLTPTNHNNNAATLQKKVNLYRNDKVNVVYQNGDRLDNVKYKKVAADIDSGKCRITKY